VSRAKLARGCRHFRATARILSGRWPDANLPAARPGIHGNCPGSRLGWRVRNEEQVAADQEAVYKGKAISKGCEPGRTRISLVQFHEPAPRPARHSGLAAYCSKFRQ